MCQIENLSLMIISDRDCDYDCSEAESKDNSHAVAISGPEQSVRPVRQMPDHFSEAIPQSKSLS